MQPPFRLPYLTSADQFFSSCLFFSLCGSSPVQMLPRTSLRRGPTIASTGLVRALSVRDWCHEYCRKYPEASASACVDECRNSKVVTVIALLTPAYLDTMTNCSCITENQCYASTGSRSRTVRGTSTKPVGYGDIPSVSSLARLIGRQRPTLAIAIIISADAGPHNLLAYRTICQQLE